MSEGDEEEEDRARVPARWHALALIHGFNELGRLAENMGQKIVCRLGVNSAVARYRELGGEIEMKEAENRIAFLGPIELPTVNLYPRDIEMMRKAVVDFDARIVIDPDHCAWTGLDDDDWNGSVLNNWLSVIKGRQVEIVSGPGRTEDQIERMRAAVARVASSVTVTR